MLEKLHPPSYYFQADSVGKQFLRAIDKKTYCP